MGNNVKCPGCNGEFVVNGEEHTVVCPYCGRETDALKARKYYAVFQKEAGEKKEVHGEEYFAFETLLEKAAFHLGKQEYEKAERYYKAAIERAPRDYRGYMGMVACKTKNYTDFKDVSHKEYLVKAMDVADENAKKQISAVYKVYDMKASMTDKEYSDYLSEKQKDYKARIKKAILGLAKVNDEGKKKAKISFILIFVLIGIGLICCVLGAFLNFYLIILGMLFMCSAYAPFTIWQKQKKSEKYYCFLVELFNHLVSFRFNAKNEKDGMQTMLDYMKDILLGIKNGDPDMKIENTLHKMCCFVADESDCKEGVTFLKSQPLTAKYFE